MARKTVRSLEPLKWMVIGSAATLLVVWGPHKVIDQVEAAGAWVSASVRGLF